MRIGISRRTVLTAIGIGGVLLVAGGVFLARTMNLSACPLCVLQRMVYLLLALESLIFFRWANGKAGTAAALVMALSAGLGASIAGYQTWLQRFATGVSCTADMPWWEQLVNWAGERIPLLFEATGLCSEAGWKVLQLSIAEWSLLIFTAMTLAALSALRDARSGLAR